MKKRLISLLLVLCMLFPTGAYAEDLPDADVHEEPTEQTEVSEIELTEEPEEEPEEEPDPGFECPHESADATDLWYYDFDEDKAVDNGDGTHTVPGYLVTEWFCYSCERTFEVRAEEPDSVTDMHYYFHDVCTTCGAQNPCDHSTGEQEIYKKNREIAEGSVKDNGDGTHTVKFRNNIEYICHNCSSEYVVYGETWTEDANEKHDWHINGFCSVCFADNFCKHPNLEESEIKKPGRYYQYDDDVHTVCGGVYNLYSCTDCGMAYEDYQREFMEDEPHDFTNGNCPCGACGHVNAESDPDDSWETMENALDNGDGTHTGTLVIYTEYYCPDCHEYIVRATGTQEGVTRNHEFNADGTCSFCSAENTCAHDGGQYTVIESRVNYGTLISSNEKTHSFPSTLYILTYCELCGECTDQQTIKELYTRPHRFVDNVCDDCEYESECLHENVHEVYTFYSDYDLGYSVPVDGISRHTVPGYVIVCNECLDCGQSTMADLFVSESTEPHFYNDNGYCYACGYLNACDHWNVAEAERTDCGSASDTGEEGHTVNTWSSVYRYCEDCGIYLGEETGPEDITEKVLPHSYQNGVCNECGHVNPCTHENTETCSVKQYTELSFDQTQHTIYVQEQLQTICECGELISCTSAGGAEMVTEKHTMTWDGSYYVCDVCGYLTKTAPCKTHKYVKVKAAAATCTEPGHKEYYECSVCGAYKTEPVVIPAKGHSEKLVPAVEKTCTEPGWSEYIVCSVCGIPLTTPVADDPVGHVPVDDPAVEGNCITMGLTAGSHCSVCSKILEEQEKLGYGDHSYDDFECVNCGRIADIEYIEIGREEIDLGVKDSYQIAPFVFPGKAAGHLVYSSSNPSIAKVNGNGLVTALKPGNASISVMGDGQQETLDVHVYAGVSKLVMNCKTMQMEIGHYNELSVNVTGFSANDLTWTSSAPSIVEVRGADGNNVTLGANQAGTATIKVKASNGKSATCKVTVVDPTKLAGVKLQAAITKPFIGEQFSFIASTVPTFTEEDGVQISYKSSNPKVLSIDEATGWAEANAAGTVTVTATAAMGKVKKSASMKITVTDPAKLTGLAADGIAAKQTMYAGDTLDGFLVALPATGEMEANVSYSVKVANPALLSAELDGSRVTLTATAPGSTKVTFTAIAGKVKKSFTSTVTIKDPSAPKSVKIVGNNMPEIVPGVPTSISYIAQIDAENCNESAYTVSWKSSNTKVATVDSEGTLTLLKPGTINLSVTVKYGKVTKTAKQKITILDQSVLYSVTAKNSSMEGKVGGRLKLDTVIRPYGLDRSTISLTFSSSSAKLATVDESGYVELLAPGTVTISVTAKQGKVSKTTKVKIKIVSASN